MKIINLINLISSLSTNNYPINKSWSSMVQSISEYYQKLQELIKYNWYWIWIWINKLNNQQDTKTEINNSLKPKILSYFSLIWIKSSHSFSNNYKDFWNRKNKSKYKPLNEWWISKKLISNVRNNKRVLYKVFL